MNGHSRVAVRGLEIERLTVRIPRNGTVVHAATDVCLTVAAGRVMALVGESGCGKSIVASAVTGLLPPGAVASGTVVLRVADGDLDTLTTGLRFRGRHVGFVPQSPVTHFTPVRTIRSQLDEALVALGTGWTAAELVARAGLAASALELYPHELSGGMAQRAAVAAALAGDPEVLVADEPTSGLDSARTDDVLNLLRTCADDGAAVLLITHDLAALLRTGIADTLAVMYASRLLELGPATEVLTDPWHPYTRDLLAALPERGLHPLPHLSPELTDLTEHDCPYTRGPSELRIVGNRAVRGGAWTEGESC
ncbi:ABC transporter ATP-binding protein [Nocardia puris]|uniref:Nickel import system ATP-binding protein NikD n=1 Tax=Nocardia puris TaxID=208602 RepID=A0A366DHB8_9NOCA|nr:ATP-binding cassette domain-containing protein [Nocardia puris]MBF6213297.1 ABC transporter ATP-binding protein [Nocardia puris]MBF6369889.1 ABC transporter ATP-binding protein [Nocardia puris]MBF6462176.1 ABC transporter ATP-binding protein [Nocardia puris]RBO89482.1 peptide/nickel transport system ATP-binding protein [Nocardia puris]